MAFETQVDKLWDRLNEDITNDTFNSKHYLYPQINDIMDELGISKSWRKEIWTNFMYEVKYVKRKPARNLEWVDGCHAQLYDTFMCKDCGCFIHTRDDIEECFDPVFCPVCTPTERITWAYDVNDGSEHYKELYKHNMHMKEYHRKRGHWFWRRWMDFKTDVSIFKYRITDKVMSKISSSYRLKKEERLKKMRLGV